MKHLFKCLTNPVIAAGLVVGTFMISPLVGRANIDLLQLPSPASSKATKSLLLDVERVGTDLFAVGEFGQILLSKDNGATWDATKVPTSVLLTAVSFKDEVTGFAVGHDGVVLRSDDGGLSWNKILDGNDINQFALDAAKLRVIELEKRLLSIPEMDSATREQLQIEIEDAEFTADTAQGDLEVGPFKPLLDVLAFRDGTVYVAGAYGQLLVSHDNGFNWTYLGGRVQNPQGYHLNTLAKTTAGHVIVGGEQGRVFLTTDKGDTWQNLSISYDGSIFHLLEHPKSGNLYAFCLRGNLFKLEAGQSRWRAVPTGLSETLTKGLVLRDESILVVGARGVLIRTNNEFQSLEVERRADKQPSSAAVQLDANKVLVAGMRGFKTLSIDIFNEKAQEGNGAK